MSIEDKKAIARRFINAAVRGEIRADMLSEDFVFWNPMTGDLSRDAVLAMPNALKSAFKNHLQLEETGITVEGNRVAIEARSEGELVNGDRYKNTYHFLIEFAPDGKIRRLREHLDTHRAQVLLKALGLME
jgi:uncharacterized protein